MATIRVAPRTVGWLIRGWLVLVAAMLVGAAAISAGGGAGGAPGGRAGPVRWLDVPAATRFVLSAPPRFPASAVNPARPFSLGHAAAADRGRALECLAAAIYYEAASEPDAGQQAVAQVVLNRVRHPAFPASVCGVVYQRSDSGYCQFSFACDGAAARAPARAAWAHAVRVAALALAGRVYAPVGLATHYHSYAVTPAWNRGLVLTAMVGAHLFHRWSGAPGTAAAFRQIYRGDEPAPPVFAAPGGDVPLPLAPVPAVAAVVPAGVAIIDAPAAAPIQSGDVLDRWRDTGTPLR